MIKKIQSGEYLKRVNNMTGEERSDYQNRVGAWLTAHAERLTTLSENPEAVLQDVQAISVAWNDNECQAWEEGVLLLSALSAQCETWLPDMIYAKSAKRCIKRMITLLTEITTCKEETPHADGEQQHKFVSEEQDKNTVLSSAGTGVPVRPKHIDQYVHLLPQKTQERASQVREWLNELDASREMVRLLMENPQASAADRESWAKKVLLLDNKVRNIFQELDMEWEKLVKAGKVTVDDLGNAHVNPNTPIEEEKPEEETPTTEKKPKEENEPVQTPEDDVRAKVATLRRWLIDTRNAVSEKQVKKWTAKYIEMVELGGQEAITDKVVDAAKHYGIALDEISTK